MDSTEWRNKYFFLFFPPYFQVAQGSTDPKNQRRRTSKGCGFGPRTSTVTTWPLRAPASEDWNYPAEQGTNAKLLAAAAPIFWPDDYHDSPPPLHLPPWPFPPPLPTTSSPGHGHDSQIRHCKNICLMYQYQHTKHMLHVSASRCFSPLLQWPARWLCYPSAPPRPLPCRVDLYSWHYWTHFPSLTTSLTIQGDGRRTSNQRLWRRESQTEGGG